MNSNCHGLQLFSRMTAAQRAAKDNVEDAKGPPARLTPYVFFFLPFFLKKKYSFSRYELFCYLVIPIS